MARELQPLSRAQIETFKRDGALVLRGFISREQINEWTSEWWHYIQASPAHPWGNDALDALPWPGEPRVRKGYVGDQGAGFRPVNKLVDLPQVKAVAVQLGGGAFTTGYPFDGHMIPTWPLPPEKRGEWQPGRGVHLDNYGPNGWTGGFNNGFGITALLNHAPARAGCFTYWPGSHKHAHEYFATHPAHIDGGFSIEGVGKKTWDEFWATDPHASHGGQPSSNPGVQLVGQAGDVILWHGWLMHSGSANAADFPRLALFGSYRHKQMHMPNNPIRPPNFEPVDSLKRQTELRYQIPPLSDPWQFWGPAVRDIRIGQSKL